VSGDLTGALDMTIAGPVYVLKDTSLVSGKAGDRDIVKLLRGEKQTFSIRNMPPGALNNTTKMIKGQNGNFYFLDPKGKRIIVSTNDGDIGDSLYLKQYVFDAEQVGTLQDLSVDPDGSRLYVLDEKKIYVVDLQEK
jgi:DNA-binding beta-propeller fold protein YncE